MLNPINSNQDTITSLELAEMSGKQHYDIMKAIRKMEDAWVELGQGNFSLSSYINQQNRQMPMYFLTKTESLYIASKFNDTVRAKLVLRWEELEREQAVQSQSPLDALEAMIKNMRLQEQRQRAIEQEQQQQAAEIQDLKAHQTTRPDCYSVAGYATLKGHR